MIPHYLLSAACAPDCRSRCPGRVHWAPPHDGATHAPAGGGNSQQQQIPTRANEEIVSTLVVYSEGIVSTLVVYSDEQVCTLVAYIEYFGNVVCTLEVYSVDIVSTLEVCALELSI